MFGLRGTADTKLGVSTGKIPAVSWPWQTIYKSLLVSKEGKDEPCAGHVSGSIVEVLAVFDFLSWDGTIGSESDPSYYLEKRKAANNGLAANATRLARASIGASFFLATGMHTAVEVAPTVRAYLGLEAADKASDIWNRICANDMTSYITDLIKSQGDDTGKTKVVATRK